MNVSRIANSFAESSISVSPRVTRLVAGIEAQVADPELDRPLGRAAPHQRPQPGEQLGEGERLGQVVVGAAVEAGDPVGDRVARGQQQDRRPDPGLAQPPADLEPVDPGQHDVEHDRVVVGRLGHPERVLALDRDVGGDSLAAHPAPDQAGHLHLVLDDQHAHGGPAKPRREDEKRDESPGGFHRRFHLQRG